MANREYSIIHNKVKAVYVVKYSEGPPGARERRTKQVPSSVGDRLSAERWAEAWWAQRGAAGHNPASPKDTVSTLCARWAEHLRSKGKEREAKDADTLKRLHVDPSKLAKVEAEALTLPQSVQWVEWVQSRGLADFTVRNVVQRMRTLFVDARGHGWVSPEKPNHFADDYLRRMLKGAQPKAGKDVIVHLPLAEARKVADYSGDGVPMRRHAKNVLALFTGLRAGELAGLSWAHLDLDSGLPSVRVDRQLTRERAFKDPKKRSFRTVPVHPLAAEVMRSWRDVGFRGHTGEGPNADDPVFPDARGKFIYDNHAPYFRVDLAEYGCPLKHQGAPVDFHSLRRTFMTLLSEAEVPDPTIKQLAGHAKQGVTRRSYIAPKELLALTQAVLRLPFDAPAGRPRTPPEAAKQATVISLAGRRRKAV